MKKSIGYIVLAGILLFVFVFKDVFCSYIIKKDFNLEKNIILDTDYQNLKQEYDELLKVNNLNLPFVVEGEISKVILHDPYIFFEEITILKRSKQRIKKDDVIVNELGYVGKVTNVLENTSQIKLLTSTNTLLSVKVKNSYGILKKEGEKLVISDITSKETIEKDTVVYTSSFTNVPGEIPVGKVTEVLSNNLEQKIVVEPFVDFNNLNYVVIRKSVSYE